jgi:hypothetical protein
MQQLSEIDKAYKKQDDDYVDGLIEQLNKTQEERIKDAIAMFGAEEYEKMTGAKLPHKIEELARTISQTPAPKKDRIKGSEKNPQGTASTRSESGGIEVSEQVEETLRNKIADFKKRHPNRNAPSLGTLKKVFRRGAGAFSTSYRPTISGGAPNSRNAWAIARVNKFLKMAGGGEVKKSYREADGDLLGAIFGDGDLLELDCGTGSGGFKAGNTCSKGGDGSKTTKDAPAKGVEEKKGALRRIAEGAKIKAQYGASKAGEIRDYLQSPAGRDLRDNISKALKIAYKGGIESVASVQSHRYKILIGALINPALGGELIAGAGIAGFIKGAVKEYNSQQGRSSSKGIARFQAMGSVVTLARTPSDSEIADYITDEILVAIKEEVTNQKDFCITTSFEYDPLQNRDESGKWTGGGDSGRGRGEGKSGVGEGYTSIKQEAEWVYSKILDNPNLEMDRPENQREAKQWSEAVAKDGLGADTSVELQNKSDEMINAVADYTGSGSILMNSESRSEPEKDPNSPDFTIGDKKELLDKAIKIFPNNEQSTIYRGMTEDQAKHAKNKTQSQTRELASTLQVGSEFVDKGFVSTSRDAYVGAKFASLSQLYTNLIGIDEYGDGNPLKEISTYNKNGQFGKMDAKAVKSAFGKSNVYKDTSFFESDLFKDMAKNGNGFLVNPLVGDTKSRLYLTINKAKGRGMAVPRFMNAGSMSKEQEVILPRKSRFRVTEITRVPLYQSNLTGTKEPEVVGNLVSAKVELL